MASPSRITRNRFHGAEKELSARRTELMERFARQRSEVFEEPEPDDEGAEANRNLARHMILATLDRERRTLAEIELALKRLKSGEYGTCNVCGGEIPDARLRALPWATLCLKCADRSVPAYAESPASRLRSSRLEPDTFSASHSVILKHK